MSLPESYMYLLINSFCQGLWILFQNCHYFIVIIIVRYYHRYCYFIIIIDFIIIIIIIIVIIIMPFFKVRLFVSGTYSNISDDQLDDLVRQAQSVHNGIELNSQGFRIQCERVCQSLLRTDPTVLGTWITCFVAH